MTSFRRSIAALALGSALAFVAAGAHAQVSLCSDPSPNEDFDGDGFTDAEEALGLPLSPGLAFVDVAGNQVTTVPSCCGQELPRSTCLEPAAPDLFALVREASPTGLPADLFGPLAAPVGQGGLGITVHRLVDNRNADDDSRLVSPSSALGQNAVQLTELLDTQAEILGIANYGTPNNLDRARIWTERIRLFVEKECSADPANCQTEQGDVGVDAITARLTRWVASHETGHMLRLTSAYERRFGGYHERSGSSIVMEQFPVVQTKGKSPPTFFIPGAFSELSAADRQLK